MLAGSGWPIADNGQQRLSGVYQEATVRVDGDLNGTDNALHAAKLEAQSKDVTK